MNWNEIQQHWPDLKARIRAEHPDVDADALERTEQGRRQLLQLLEAKYGSTQPVAQTRVDDMVEDDTDGR